MHECVWQAEFYGHEQSTERYSSRTPDFLACVALGVRLLRVCSSFGSKADSKKSATWYGSHRGSNNNFSTRGLLPRNPPFSNSLAPPPFCFDGLRSISPVHPLSNRRLSHWAIGISNRPSWVISPAIYDITRDSVPAIIRRQAESQWAGQGQYGAWRTSEQGHYPRRL